MTTGGESEMPDSLRQLAADLSELRIHPHSMHMDDIVSIKALHERATALLAAEQDEGWTRLDVRPPRLMEDADMAGDVLWASANSVQTAEYDSPPEWATHWRSISSIALPASDAPADEPPRVECTLSQATRERISEAFAPDAAPAEGETPSLQEPPEASTPTGNPRPESDCISPQDGLREALDSQKLWHESERKALGKQPPSNDTNWRRMQHAEQIEAIDEALAATPPAAEDEEPERPSGIPAPTFKVRRPDEDLHGWLAQRITYATFIEGKMPDADRRYLAKCWVRDLNQALSVLDKHAASPTPSDTGLRERLAAEVLAERDRQDGKWGGADHDDTFGPTDWFDVLADYNGWARRMVLMGSLDKARRRYVQIAALAMAAVESIDRSLLAADDGGKGE